jgi:Flp pilus assembly protein TadD
MAEAERYQHYEVLRRADGSLWELGRGAMGITYKAFDTNLRFPVALKVINNAYLNSDVARRRFLREARAAAALRQQNVASVFHLGTDQESYFYAMEFIDGETVDAYMKRIGPLRPIEALGITVQVSRALAAAAKQQLVHRDLKPANLMLADEEGEKVVKVIDFGLAKGVKREEEDSGALTVGGSFVGTPLFASPEQLEERDIDIRSDIYSLGAALYYMVTGRPPFSGSVLQIMSQHLYKPLPLEPLEGLPSALVELIKRMMEKDRAKRPQTPADLKQEILYCLEEIQDDARAASRPGPVAQSTLFTDRPEFPTTGEVLAQRYQITRDLGDITQGRRFLANDLQLDRKISVLAFNRDFLAGSKSYTALKQEIDQLRRAARAELRQIYSLESAGQQSFLVEEHVIGPALVEVLRARSVLSPPEAFLLLKLLAPVADWAQANRLQQVDLTVSGIQLISPGLSEISISSQLQRPLVQWTQLGVKVASVDYSFSSSDSATWAGSTTLVQTPSGTRPRASYLSRLALLVYELLGGPRNSVESTGRYTPIAILTEQGNAILRRGLIDDLPSAAEFARLLEATIHTRGVEPGTPWAPIPVSPATHSGSTLAKTPASPPPPAVTQPAPYPLPLPGGSLLQKPHGAEKRKMSVPSLLLVSVLILVVTGGLLSGGYALYRYLNGPEIAHLGDTGPTSQRRTTPLPTPEERATPAPTTQKERTTLPIPEIRGMPALMMAAVPVQYKQGVYSRRQTYYVKQIDDKTVNECTQAIDLNPNDVNAYSSRGNAYYDQQNYEKALGDYTLAISLAPNDATFYDKRGLAYYEQKEFDKAIACFTQAIRLDPDDATANNNRGVASYAQRKYDEAIDAYTVAIRLTPNDATAYNNRGLAYTERGIAFKDPVSYAKAINDFNEAIRLDPHLGVAYNDRGFAYYQQKNYDKALNDYNGAIRLDPKSVLAYNNRGRIYSVSVTRRTTVRDSVNVVEDFYDIYA